ncbi:glycoside hydrolase family 127 protein [Celerinatantimonas sp. YJH-8]|uniref:glycoside hydrolase family 127 protein n=1 Tax=Celerinatantimonas sp. YJH-8 TaxID=3228714 RepID=UPI0038C9A110
MMTQTTEAQFTQIQITDPFWGQYQSLINEVVIPYQWDALNDNLPETEPSHAIENFKIAAGELKGDFYGMVFQDSDVAKWLESVAYSLSNHPDPKLEGLADQVIELIGKAQGADGYINTYFTVQEPDGRWRNLCECHELYCAGHLIEAGVAYYCATQKSRLLEIVRQFADYIDRVFGTQPGQLQGYPGHPEIELALMRLYEVTDESRYMKLAQFFIEQRGQTPHYYDEEYQRRGETSYWHTHGPAWMIHDKAYSQAHLPLDQQRQAVGHAVRFVYLLTGVAHLASRCGDQRKIALCKTLWDNMVNKQMYVTGGIGSQSEGEAFSCDYDLPNDTAYTETCASIGLIMLARRMLELETNSHYGDVMERALYNTVLAGMALDGKHFFYVNPLEVYPEAIGHNHIYDHVKAVRQRWFGCACCPPNIARLIGSLGNYMYTVKPDQILVNLYIASHATLMTHAGIFQFRMEGHYPRENQMLLHIEQAPESAMTLGLRIPDWCPDAQIDVNGKPLQVNARQHQGYALITRNWQCGDKICLRMVMTPRIIRGNPKLRHSAGQIAVQRGPIVYCIEQSDNGIHLHNIRLSAAAVFTEVAGTGLLADKVLLKTRAVRLQLPSSAADPQWLYRYDADAPQWVEQPLTLIPYFTWANRGEGEMRVWINEQLSL